MYGHDQDRGHEEHDHRDRRALREELTPERRLEHEDRGQVAHERRAALREHEDEVEHLQRRVAEQHDRARGDRPHERQDDVAVDARLRRAIHPCRLPQLVGDAAQPGEIERHDEARHLPDRGDRDGADDRSRVGRQAGSQDVDAQVVEDLPERLEEAGLEKEPPHVIDDGPRDEDVDPIGRVEDPGPDRARDDERDGHRQQEDGPEDRLTADLLVDEDREQEPEERGSPSRRRA